MVTVIINGLWFSFDDYSRLVEVLDSEADDSGSTNEPDGIEWH